MAKKKKQDYKDLTFEEKVKEWVTLYRRNPQIFAERYLEVKLYPYQRMWLYLMSRYKSFVTVGARSMAKSWIIALYGIIKAILYPGSTIVIASSTKQQAGLIVSEKIKGIFYEKYPNIRREIKIIKTAKDEIIVEFFNGSKIIVVPANDNARGHRSQFNIYEEFRIMKKSVVDNILRPFLAVRQIPFMHDPKYSNYKEEGQEAYISSAGFKSEWIWEALKTHINNYYNKGNMGFFGCDYLIAIKHNIKTWADIDMARASSNGISFSIEYENIMYGESDTAFFKYTDFQKLQKDKRPFYPLPFDSMITRSPKIKNIQKENGEIRIVCCDIALSGGSKNDNSVVWCLSLIPNGKNEYNINVKYCETLNGINTTLQVLRYKQIFSDFQADYFVLDMLNAGKSVYDMFTRKIIDDHRVHENGEPIVYDAWNLVNEKYLLLNTDKTVEDCRERTLEKNGIPCIIPITANAELNHLFHMSFKDNLEKGKIEFLIDAQHGEEYLYNSNTMKPEDREEEKQYLRQPYLETEQMIMEAITLESIWNSGKLKLIESANARKDRYMSLTYGNYIATLLEKENLKEKTSSYNIQDIIRMNAMCKKERKNINNIFR